MDALVRSLHAACDAGRVAAAGAEATRFVAPGDAPALASAILSVLAETGTPAAAARLAAARAVAAEHDWGRVGQRLWDFFPHSDRRQ